MRISIGLVVLIGVTTGVRCGGVAERLLRTHLVANSQNMNPRTMKKMKETRTTTKQG